MNVWYVYPVSRFIWPVTTNTIVVSDMTSGKVRILCPLLRAVYDVCKWEGIFCYGPLTRYVKLGVAHAPWMPGTFSPPPRVSDPDMHHGTCVTHVLWCMPGSLTSGFPWSRWRGKRSRHSRCMRNPQFYIFGKRSMMVVFVCLHRTIPLSLTKVYV